MKIVIFGLTVSSSWGNGHATLWRALIRALSGRGHQVIFFERDVPYYSTTRDLYQLPAGRLVLYRSWDEVYDSAAAELADADVGMVTSYCPDGRVACDLVLNSSATVKTFYDLDTPVTLQRLREGDDVLYLPRNGLGDFDIVLSYTGGLALDALRGRLGARRVAPLYGHVDPDRHFPAPVANAYRCDCSYMGTYAADRQQVLQTLFIDPARALPKRRFLLGGSLYPPDLAWPDNVYFVRHLTPHQHPAFFSSSRLTVNATRQAMADMGHCPSGRLFEAAACKTCILSDWWVGLDAFFTPNREILVGRTTQDAIDAIERPDEELERIATAARERVLSEHTSDHRAAEFERIMDECASGRGHRWSMPYADEGASPSWTEEGQ